MNNRLCPMKRIAVATVNPLGWGLGWLIGVENYAKLLPDWNVTARLLDAREPIDPAGCDGLILVNCIDRLSAAKSRLRRKPAKGASRRPPAIVSITHRTVKTPGVINLTISTRGIARRAVELLANRNCRSFAFVGDHLDYLRRLAGAYHRDWCAALAERGLAESGSFWPEIHPGWALTPERIETFRAWVDALPKPAGIFVPSLEIARHVTEGLRLCGIRIPDEVRLVCGEDFPDFAECMNPPVSAIGFRRREIGYLAARLLHRALAGEKVEDLVYDSFVIAERASTRPVLTASHTVARAREYIRGKIAARIPFTIPDIAHALNLSRRTLEMHFRTNAGCTLLEEIRFHRVERMKKLLRTTDYSIAYIANESGFTSVGSAINAFRALTEQTPSAFRGSRPNKPGTNPAKTTVRAPSRRR